LDGVIGQVFFGKKAFGLMELRGFFGFWGVDKVLGGSRVGGETSAV
jgi:hypothetical protein